MPKKINKGRSKPNALGGEVEPRRLKEGKKSVADRDLAVKVKTARGRKLGSTIWLQRQLNDPFVARAKKEGYRSRAAYKMIELDDQFRIFKPGARIVDLGAAPGGWCQVAVQRTKGRGQVVGIDYLEMEDVPGTELLQLDFLDEGADEALKAKLGGPADAVLSDMAAPTTGHRATDHMRIIALADEALGFAETVLAPGGTFVAKVLQGGSEKELLNRLKRNFRRVHHAKPEASRANSAEMYVVGLGFRGEGAGS
ncbi:MAG: RlmE family RNA methyltransferase [Pseudomonadota bacterium]